MKQYKYQVSPNEYIEFRSLTAEESDRFYYILSQQNNPYLEEIIFNKITENKYNTDELTAGVIPIIIYLSFKISGYLENPESIFDLLANQREANSKNIFLKIFYSQIIRIMPQYKLEDLKNKTLNELIELLTLAEDIIGKELFTIPKKDKPLAKSKPSHSISSPKITKKELELLKAVLQTEELE